jgi:hypothetical protein
MAKWTAEKRRNTPKSDFGEPSKNAFPIEDQEDLENAARLLGHAGNPEAVKARLISIARRLDLTLPESWQADAKMSADADEAGAALDTAGFAEDGDYILYKDSLLFRCGAYPDKDFSLTPEEAWAAVEQFKEPVPVDLEHVPTILDSKLGEVREIRLSDDGEEIRGTVAIPKWLDAVLDEGSRKVSATWDRATKTLQKLALVRSPRVADAALMSAYFAANPEPLDAAFVAAHETSHGKAMIQAIHDHAAQGGRDLLPRQFPRHDGDRPQGRRRQLRRGRPGLAASSRPPASGPTSRRSTTPPWPAAPSAPSPPAVPRR